MSIAEIVNAYTSGQVGLEETNAALKEAGASFYFDPEKNVLTEEELAATTVGETPEEVNGWGLLDTGTGTLDKVQVVDGVTPGFDAGGMYVIVMIGGKWFNMKGNKLVEYGA